MSFPSALAPHVVVFATEDLVQLLQSNELPPLHQLLESFSPLGQVITRTIALVPVTHSSFTLRFSDLVQIESACREDEETRAGRSIDWLGGRLARHSTGWVQDLESRKKGEPMKGDTKWWQEMKQVVDGDRIPLRGEGWNHPVALILATTTLSVNPLQAIANIHTRLTDFPAWVDHNILKYTLIVHPLGRSSLSLDETNALMNGTKKQFGLHCHLLSLNLQKSAKTRPLKPSPPQLPPATTMPKTPGQHGLTEPAARNGVVEHSAYAVSLSEEDTVNLTRFSREFVTQSLVPWMERCIVEWNETYSSSRRLPSRLFTSTRKLFGSTTPASSSGFSTPTSPTLTSNNTPFSEALAPQRRLAEFATWLGDFKFAVPLWESIRKDGRGGSDVLPLLLKGQRETAEAHAAWALAPLTTGHALGGRDDVRIGAAAQWKALSYAVRWEQGVSDILDLGGEKWLVWAAGSTEEAPMAILIAQAALMSMRKGYRRLASMWYVFAANRLEKCGLRALAMYFFRTARDLYLVPPEKILSPSFEDVEGKDHPPLGLQGILPSIEYSLGRLLYKTGDIAGAVTLFLGLLKGFVFIHGVPGDVDKVLLEDFRLAFQHYQNTSSDKVNLSSWTLPISISRASQTRRRFAIAHTLDGDVVDSDETTQGVMNTLSDRWRTFWRAHSPGGKESLEKSGSGEVGERFWVDVVLKNPLNTELSLFDVTVHLREVGKDAHSALPEGVEVEMVPEITLAANERRTMSFWISSSRVVSLEVARFAFNFLGLLPVQESLGIPGKRLNSTVEQQRSLSYGPEGFMSINVKQSGGRLRGDLITNPQLPQSIVVGELRRMTLRLTNLGMTGIDEIWLLFHEAGPLGVWIGPEDTLGSNEFDLTVPASNSLLLSHPFRLALERHHSSSVLAPHESIHIPLIIQTQVLWSLDLSAMLIFRQSASSPIFYSSLMRQSFDVEPIFEVFSTLTPSTSSDLTYSCAVEIENTGTLGEISLTQVSMTSPSWTFQSMTESTTLNIPERQVAKLVTTVQPGQLEASEAPIVPAVTEFLVRQMGEVLKRRPVAKELPPRVELRVSHLLPTSSMPASSMVSHFLHAARRQRLIASLALQFPLIATTDIPHIFPLYANSDVDLTIHWTITGTPDRSGFTLVSGLAVGPSRALFADAVLRAEGGGEPDGTKASRSMYAETTREKEALVSSIKSSHYNREDDPLLVIVRCSEQLHHDFKNGPKAVPVEFEVRNTSSHPVEFTLVLSPLEHLSRSSLSPAFTGKLRHRKSLGPHDSATIKSWLLVLRPGLYTVNNWRMEVQYGRIDSLGHPSEITAFAQASEDYPENTFVVLEST